MNFLQVEPLIGATDATPILSSAVIAAAIASFVQYLIFKRGHSGQIKSTEAQTLWNILTKDNADIRAENAVIKKDNAEIRTENIQLRNRVEEVSDHCRMELAEMRNQHERAMEELHIELRRLRRS